MTNWDIFWGLTTIGIVLVLARMLKSRVRLFQKLFIPSSIIAGFLILLAGPQLLGYLIRTFGDEAAPFASGLFPESFIQIWSGLPSILISVVFAALFLGKPIPSFREIWMRAGPQVMFGQTLAWGQYVVGIALCLFVLTPFFGTNPLAGALIEISFEGGHGTASGMSEAFESLGFPEGASMALGLATIGLVSGVLIGTVLINLAARRGVIPLRAQSAALADPLFAPDISDADSANDLRDLYQQKAQEARTMDPLSVHLGVVGLAITLGWLLKEALLFIEARTWGGQGGFELFKHVPLFPLAMIGGVIIQIVVDKTRQQHHINRRLMNRISGTALDFTIVAALGTLPLRTLGEHMGPFLLLALAGVVWNVFALLVLAPRLIPLNWFERGVGDFGQSMGVTVTGILLMRMADPTNESGALESFGYKQLMFEPIVGGGLFTAMSMPLLAHFGPVPILALTTFIMSFWILLGYRLFGRRRRPI
jgi:glutamate:Na+ symporter, ESS family